MASNLPSWMEQLVGATLMTLALLDVFLTVLYARAGTGIFARRVSHVLWWVFRHLSRLAGSSNKSQESRSGRNL
ncbi:MAG: hypothetical protein JWP08_1083 [Bryobacterales bacterium]|nr:hypothetical protein [Bryobacterales bacterium]